MSRLFGTMAYLCGAMDRVKDGGVGWRNMITPKLNKLGVIVLDPANKPIMGDVGFEEERERAERAILKQEERYQEIKEKVKWIRTTDLRMVDKSDFLICNIDVGVHACGTYEEIFLANRQKKPIILHVEQGKQATPDWLLGALNPELIFDEWDHVVKYLTDEVAYLENYNTLETYNRWILFNLEKPTKQMLEAYNGK
jgi:nucleoside 2-deoxyribosyltransferase